MSGAPTTYPWITGLGLVTPAGPNVPSSACALRAGLQCFSELPGHWVRDDDGAPVAVLGSRIPESLPLEPGRARLTSHALRALREALSDAGVKDPGRAGPRLYLGHDPCFDPRFLLRALSAELPGATSPALFADGRCAALTALAAAHSDVMAGRIEMAVVGALDSWVELPRVFQLQSEKRLMMPDVPEGTIPGEAAGFLVLEARESALERGAKPYACAVGVGAGEEPTAGTDRPCQGEALAGALRRALQVAPPGGRKDLPPIWCDLNGDHYRALEWGIASTRVFRLLEGDWAVHQPAGSIGDCGAAMGIVNLAWAATVLRQKHTVAPEALIWGASEGTPRAAALLMPEGEPH